MLTAVTAFMRRSLRWFCMKNNAVTRPITQSNNEELENAGKEESGII